MHNIQKWTEGNTNNRHTCENWSYQGCQNWSYQVWRDREEGTHIQFMVLEMEGGKEGSTKWSTEVENGRKKIIRFRVKSYSSGEVDLRYDVHPTLDKHPVSSCSKPLRNLRVAVFMHPHSQCFFHVLRSSTRWSVLLILPGITPFIFANHCDVYVAKVF